MKNNNNNNLLGLQQQQQQQQPKSRGYRDHLAIKAQILQVFLEAREQIITPYILLKTISLSHSQAIRHLADLCTLRFLEIITPNNNISRRRARFFPTNKPFYYRLTERGKLFLDIYQQMISLLIL